jgi:hypothetical protein
VERAAEAGAVEGKGYRKKQISIIPRNKKIWYFFYDSFLATDSNIMKSLTRQFPRNCFKKRRNDES